MTLNEKFLKALNDSPLSKEVAENMNKSLQEHLQETGRRSKEFWDQLK